MADSLKIYHYFGEATFDLEVALSQLVNKYKDLGYERIKIDSSDYSQNANALYDEKFQNLKSLTSNGNLWDSKILFDFRELEKINLPKNKDNPVTHEVKETKAAVIKADDYSSFVLQQCNEPLDGAVIILSHNYKNISELPKELQVIVSQPEVTQQAFKLSYSFSDKRNWIKEQLSIKKLQLNESMIGRLIDSGLEQFSVYQVLQKLSLLDVPIEDKHLDYAISENDQHRIFEIIKLILSKKLLGLVLLAASLKAKPLDAVIFCALLAAKIREIYLLSTLIEKNVPANEAQKLTKTPLWLFKQNWQLAQNISASDCQLMLQRIAAEDLKIKYSGKNGANLLLVLCQKLIILLKSPNKALSYRLFRQNNTRSRTIN